MNTSTERAHSTVKGIWRSTPSIQRLFLLWVVLSIALPLKKKSLIVLAEGETGNHLVCICTNHRTFWKYYNIHISLWCLPFRTVNSTWSSLQVMCLLTNRGIQVPAPWCPVNSWYLQVMYDTSVVGVWEVGGSRGGHFTSSWSRIEYTLGITEGIEEQE